ncbi:MAG: metallophosphoesterase [Trichlorobacter sp.]|uniref:metallophosphoesterase n=1 Tax=Trichlorobacter sp. TaxID=2911007 RepID=UPI0025647C1F|nr:metallophosphoesterase [Trichlorobacter sp.]
MRILLVSDTHGNQTALLQAHETAGSCDAVIHLGDGEQDTLLLKAIDDQIQLIQVAGNCDLGSTLPRELLCEFGEVRLLLCHGDRYGVKSGLSRLIERGHAATVDAVLYGHTHLAQSVEQEGLLLVNPGTLAVPDPYRSYAILEITESGITATIHPLT